MLDGVPNQHVQDLDELDRVLDHQLWYTPVDIQVQFQALKLSLDLHCFKHIIEKLTNVELLGNNRALVKLDTRELCYLLNDLLQDPT